MTARVWFGFSMALLVLIATYYISSIPSSTEVTPSVVGNSINPFMETSKNGEQACYKKTNPCSSAADCKRCMAYAEASGDKIPDACQAAVQCAIDNRINDPSFPPTPGDACAVVSQGGGKQFNPYNCVGDCKETNQKYCDCCDGSVSPPPVPTNCSGFKGNTFNNAGDNSWASRHCKKVSPPAGCNYKGTNNPVFDFYEC